MKTVIIGAGTMGKLFAHAQKGAKAIDKKDRTPEADVYIFAVKPQDFNEAAERLKGVKGKLILSIMAGVSLAKISKTLPGNKIVRSMPNLGAQAKASMTVWMSKGSLTPKHKKAVRTILSSIGEEIEVKKEDLIDAATAITGSGPGYLYFFADQMVKNAQKLGFKKEDAEKLVKQTFKGTTEVWTKTKLSPKVLQAKVTSRKGTTEAGIKKLKENNFAGAIKKCINSAYKRAKELSKL